jgi:uncharacterized protein YjdB
MKRGNFTFIILLLLLPSLLCNSTYACAAKAKQASSAAKYTLNATSANVLLDESFTLTIDGVTDEEVSFKSEDTDIASVSSSDDASCDISGDAVGSTTITVKIKEKSFLFFNSTTTTLTCKVKVSPKATSVRFTKKSLKIAVGNKKKLSVTLRPSITTEVPVYTSSNPEVATVTAAGKVVAKSKGNTVITATLSNGGTSTCSVKVTR